MRSNLRRGSQSIGCSSEVKIVWIFLWKYRNFKLESIIIRRECISLSKCELMWNSIRILDFIVAVEKNRVAVLYNNIESVIKNVSIKSTKGCWKCPVGSVCIHYHFNTVASFFVQMLKKLVAHDVSTFICEYNLCLVCCYGIFLFNNRFLRIIFFFFKRSRNHFVF